MAFAITLIALKLTFISTCQLSIPSVYNEINQKLLTQTPMESTKLDRKSDEYKRMKAEAAEVLWKAVEKQIPDVRERAKVSLVGTPLTHERYLRRDKGVSQSLPVLQAVVYS